MIEGALKIDELKVKDIMTEFKNVECLSIDETLDETLLKKIKKFGYSRIPLCQH